MEFAASTAERFDAAALIATAFSLYCISIVIMVALAVVRIMRTAFKVMKLNRIPKKLMYLVEAKLNGRKTF